MQQLETLAAASRRLGADLRYVFLGGGNTSYKTSETLYIKPSGLQLAGIQPQDFIAMDRASVRRLFDSSLPDSPTEREAEAKRLMAAAVRPQGAGRPSVEAPLHEAMDFPFVVHLHPALVNGMTCAADGVETCRELFPDAMWIGYVDPGYTLAKHVADQLQSLERAGKNQPQVIFLQNHGVFVGGADVEEIESIYEDMLDTLAVAYDQNGIALELSTTRINRDHVMEHAPVLRAWLGAGEQRAIVKASDYFDAAEGPLTPDHIVYAGSFPYLGSLNRSEVEDHTAQFHAPRVVALRESATFTIGADRQEAENVLLAARDAALVEQLTHAFGGPEFISERGRKFIENWEVESYRKKVASTDSIPKRLSGKVCVVTGAAQGFGLGIAQGMAAEGAVVAIADMNLAGAQDAATAIEAKYGRACAFPVPVNIADEDSVRTMVGEVVQTCGGIDVLVANAGVLRAGSVMEIDASDWQFVTDVNYTGYFLCVKHISQVMSRQNSADEQASWSDIIQINSKSGLEGSNRNAAYAGSKFGTIGMTQSFAKELVEHRVKVNSICPGNYFDGPLWSDPKNGLFVQYLETGKVPGAESIADVKRFYEAKVPMGRGCRPQDVLKAILYVIEQDYETGQAIPVTGGQVMLH